MLPRILRTELISVLRPAPRRLFSSFKDKEQAEENRFFRKHDADLLQKLRHENTSSGAAGGSSSVERKLRDIFIRHGLPTEDSELFGDLLAAFSSQPERS